MLLSVPILRVDKQGPDGMELSPSNGCETALNAGRLDPETAFCYLTHTHTHTRALRRHTHPHTSFMLSLTHTAVGGSARLLWPKIRGAIINHDGLPLVKSSLSRREQRCMGAQQRQAPRLLAGTEGHAGAFSTPSTASILPRTDRWMDG